MDLDQPSYQAPDYLPVDRGELRDYTKARIRVFHEEELDVPLVLFDQVLDHVLRIDRILRQPQGHLRHIGVSGACKTMSSRFVAWMNGLTVSHPQDPVQGGRPEAGPHARHQQGAVQEVHAAGQE